MAATPAPAVDADAPLAPAVARAAAHWFVQFSSGEIGEAEQRALQRWREADPEHERAWQRVQRLGQQFGSLNAASGMAVLDRPRSVARRRAAKQLALLLVVGSAGWVGHRQQAWQGWAADYRTATGERRTLTLADGSTLHLNTHSAVDIVFTAEERRIELLHGEIFVDTAQEAGQPYRPLRVATAEGVLTALGTRFVVQQLDAAIRLGVQQGAVEIRLATAMPGAVLPVLHAGQEAVFDRRRVAPVASLDTMRLAWRDGVLFADRMPLGLFVAELARHRNGLLRCDPAVSGLLISGSFPLADTDRVLQSLTETLPVKVMSRTRYWVTVVRA